MTDEPREENRPEEEEVEGHSPPFQPPFEKLQSHEDDDVEAHSPPFQPPFQPPF